MHFLFLPVYSTHSGQFPTTEHLNRKWSLNPCIAKTTHSLMRGIPEIPLSSIQATKWLEKLKNGLPPSQIPEVQNQGLGMPSLKVPEISAPLACSSHCALSPSVSVAILPTWLFSQKDNSHVGLGTWLVWLRLNIKQVIFWGIRS